MKSPRPSQVWTCRSPPGLRSGSSYGHRRYRRRSRCTNRLIPFLASRWARGSRASLSAPRRTISPRLPLSFFFLDKRRPPLLCCPFDRKNTPNRYARSPPVPDKGVTGSPKLPKPVGEKELRAPRTSKEQASEGRRQIAPTEGEYRNPPTVAISRRLAHRA